MATYWDVRAEQKMNIQMYFHLVRAEYVASPAPFYSLQPYEVR